MTVKAKPRSLMSYLETIPDPRVNRTRKHALVDILAVTLLAVLSDADTFEDIHEFGVEQEAWLKQSWPLTNGIPSADTFSRFLQSLNPKLFGAIVGEWLAAACEATGLKHVAIDGKSIRAAKRETFAGCLHLVTAWATENGLVLGQEAVADKSNEIPAIPELLKTLDLAGALVTIDAAGTQVEIARQIVAQGGDYLLPVKKNQPKLLAACEANFAAAQTTEFVGDDVTMDASVESKHGRIDERYTLALAKPTGVPAEWPDVKVIVQMKREREVNGKRTATTVLLRLQQTARGEDSRPTDPPSLGHRKRIALGARYDLPRRHPQDAGPKRRSQPRADSTNRAHTPQTRPGQTKPQDQTKESRMESRIPTPTPARFSRKLDAATLGERPSGGECPDGNH